MQLKQTREEVAAHSVLNWKAFSRQQTLLYERLRQRRNLTQTLNERKTLPGLESSIQQGQQRLSELRANESRLRNSITRAEAAKARAELKREAQAVRPPERNDAQRHRL